MEGEATLVEVEEGEATLVEEGEATLVEEGEVTLVVEEAAAAMEAGSNQG